jgi:hypothetical protein
VEADWSVACGADDPTVMVPWTGKNKSLRFIDLRDTPVRISEIPEAARYPCLATALGRWNDSNSPLFTAKCDVWNYASDLFDAEDLPGFSHAQGSYVDLLPKNAAVFSSFAACEQLLRNWTKAAQSIELAAARCDWILRPARILPVTVDELHSLQRYDKGVDGFATTLYVWGYGSSSDAAAIAWSTALLALVEPVLFLKNSF